MKWDGRWVVEGGYGDARVRLKMQCISEAQKLLEGKGSHALV